MYTQGTSFLWKVSQAIYVWFNTDLVLEMHVAFHVHKETCMEIIQWRDLELFLREWKDLHYMDGGRDRWWQGSTICLQGLDKTNNYNKSKITVRQESQGWLQCCGFCVRWRATQLILRGSCELRKERPLWGKWLQVFWKLRWPVST